MKLTVTNNVVVTFSEGEIKLLLHILNMSSAAVVTAYCKKKKISDDPLLDFADELEDIIESSGFSTEG